MNDPKRLIDELDAGLERDLLLAAKSDRAPFGARDRTETRMLEVAAAAGATVSGLGAGAGAGGAGAGGALGKSSSGLGLLVLKWLGIGALAGGAMAVGGTEISSRLQRNVEPAKQTQADVPSKSRSGGAQLGVAEVATGAEAPVPAPEARTDSKPARGEVVIGKSATLFEAESMRAVELEAKRNPKRALVLVRQHLRRFPDGATEKRARHMERELSRRP